MEIWYDIPNVCQSVRKVSYVHRFVITAASFLYL